MAEPTRDLGEAATIVAEWLNSDDLGHTLLIESIARALRAARSSSTGWVPTSRPPTGEARMLLAWCPGESVQASYWTPGYGAFIDVGPACSRATHWQEMPEPPSDGETGGGRP